MDGVFMSLLRGGSRVSIGAASGRKQHACYGFAARRSRIVRTSPKAPPHRFASYHILSAA
ncbi:hypothetical protein [Burkholderia sp. Nafp2/4-1b]|uniref:hypothetical protein n=1 Tax=Burkholderia sp. Nafp2/4-1b TaxID=2116686 RepID=UPI0013CEFDA4|nr:hypothetical protein [Burkholderia sp. Nafp2/4-1b]